MVDRTAGMRLLVLGLLSRRPTPAGTLSSLSHAGGGAGSGGEARPSPNSAWSSEYPVAPLWVYSVSALNRADCFRVAQNYRLIGLDRSFQRKRSMHYWPICAHALTQQIQLGLEPRGHHDWPVMRIFV